MAEALAKTGGGQYFGISPLMIFPQASGDFELYLIQDRSPILYTRAGEKFQDRHRQKLYDYGVKEVFVKAEHRGAYEKYVEDNLGHVILDQSMPLEVRSRVFYDVSMNIVKEAFNQRLPKNLSAAQYHRMVRLVRTSAKFLALKDSLRGVGSLIGHDYKTYSHSLHVFIYSTAILTSLGVEDNLIVQNGLGAMLHDIGKIRIPKQIINKPGPLTKLERQQIQTHPVLGVAMVAQMPMPQVAVNAIMFHHEKEEGGGYPSGIDGRDIPLCVKAITLADVYDALTSHRPYATAKTPYQALKIMQNDMEGHFNYQMYRQFIMVLSGAKIVNFKG